MEKFALVNPVVGGTIEEFTKVSAKNSLEAAKKIYSKLSENFNNNIPKFYFTIQNISKSKIGEGDSGKYSHFLIEESKNKNDVDFRLTRYNVNGNTELFKKFKENLRKINKKINSNRKQKGGHYDLDYYEYYKRYKHDPIFDDDWLFEDDIYFPRMKRSYIYSQPISYWWYDPYVYSIKSSYYYTPTYVSTAIPYVSTPLYDLKLYI